MIKSQGFKKYNKFKPKRRKIILKNRFFWFFILISIAISIIFYLICFCSFFQVKKIDIVGNQKILSEEIKKLTEINFPRKIAFLKSQSILLIDFQKIEREILGQIPQIGIVSFERDLPERLIVSVSEREPIFLFEKDQHYFFIDKEGVIFEKISEKDNWLIVKISGIEREPKLGEQIIEKEKISQILEIQSGLKELKNEVISVEIANPQRINIKTFEGWEIYFNSQNDISNQVFNLGVILKEKISPEKRRNLEYIDLRFGNQIYYK